LQFFENFAFRGKEQSNRQFQFWQSDNHPNVLYRVPAVAQKVDGVHNDPAKEGWVTKPEYT
jgi:hypothetical protein